MSFMYEAMRNRSPSKRKIKPKEDNILRLISQIHSESEDDEDFEVKSSASSESSSTVESEEDENCDSAENNDTKNVPDSKNTEEVEVTKDKPTDSNINDKQPRKLNVRRKRRRRRRKCQSNFDPATEFVTRRKMAKVNVKTAWSDALERSKTQLYYSQKITKGKMTTSFLPRLCCVCLLTNENSTLSCKQCGIVIHNECYGFPFTTISIITNKEKKQNEKTWYCDSCICDIDAGKTKKICEFCPGEFGLLKEGLYGHWAHVVCAKHILGKQMFYNSTEVTGQSFKNLYINLETVNYKMFGLKECVLCDDSLMAKTGICIKCDAGLCNVFFHVSCAQKFGLLTRSETSIDNVKRFDLYAYCPLHCPKHDMKLRQEKYFTAQYSCTIANKNFKNNSTLLESLEILRLNGKKNKSEHRNSLPEDKTSTKPRLLSSSAHFSELLNRKAKLMFGEHVLHPALVVPTPVEIRKKTAVNPALTTDFSAYYADRHLRMIEIEGEILENKELNVKLCAEQSMIRHNLEKSKHSLILLQSEGNEIKNLNNSIRNILKSMKSWSEQPLVNKKFKKLDAQSHTALNQPKSQNDQLRIILPDMSLNHPEILLKSCGICKKNHDQHLLVKCDVCKQWQHLACLDPPLRQMPKRNRFRMWQCSECALSNGSSSSDSVDTSLGSFIATDGRRLTTRSRKAPEKLLNKLIKEKYSTEGLGSADNIKKQKRKRRRYRRKSSSATHSSIAKFAADNLQDNIAQAKTVESFEDGSHITDRTNKSVDVTVDSSTIIISSDGEGPKSIFVQTVKTELLNQVSNNSKIEKNTSKIDSLKLETAKCCICDDDKIEDKLAKCDKCKKNFHWKCCEPPLKSNPNKKYHYWECSECVPDSDSTDTDGTNQLEQDNSKAKVLPARTRKIPEKFDASSIDEDKFLELSLAQIKEYF